MLAELKLGIAAGITAFLAMCVTTPVRHISHHSTKHHTKTRHREVHESYVPSPTVIVISETPSAQVQATPPPTISATPIYKTTTHQHPPWSPSYKPDQ